MERFYISSLPSMWSFLFSIIVGRPLWTIWFDLPSIHAGEGFMSPLYGVSVEMLCGLFVPCLSASTWLCHLVTMLVEAKCGFFSRLPPPKFVCGQ